MRSSTGVSELRRIFVGGAREAASLDSREKYVKMGSPTLTSQRHRPAGPADRSRLSTDHLANSHCKCSAPFACRTLRAPRFASRRARAARCSPTWRCARANRTAATGSRRLLWEDADEELARTSLRQALAALAQVAAGRRAQARCSRTPNPSASILRSSAAICMRSAARSIAGTRTSLQEAMTHYRGDLLDGFDARSTAFDEWLSERAPDVAQGDERSAAEAHRAVQRERRQRRRARGIDASWSRSNRSTRRRTARSWSCTRSATSYAEALRQYRVCRDVLRRELDVAPEPATEQLYRDLMRKRRARRARRPRRRRRSRSTTPACTTFRTSPYRSAASSCGRSCAMRHSRGAPRRPARARSAARSGRIASRSRRSFSVASRRRCTSSAAAPIAASAPTCSRCSAFRMPTATKPSARRRPRWCCRAWWRSTPGPSPTRSRLRIGIAQGQVLCGAEIFPLTGRPTHVAHTLATRAADGEILISEEIARSRWANASARARRQRAAGQARCRCVAWSCRRCAARSARGVATLRRPPAGARDDPRGARSLHQQSSRTRDRRARRSRHRQDASGRRGSHALRASAASPCTRRRSSISASRPAGGRSRRWR